MSLVFDPIAATQRRRLLAAAKQATAAAQAAQARTGADGRTAYQVAQDAGYTGTRDQWLASLVGAAGKDGVNGAKGADGTNGSKGADGVKGADGATGAAGKSAYDLAVAGGYVGTQTQWLASLVGATGASGVAYLTVGSAPVSALVANVAADVTIGLQDAMPGTTYNCRFLGMGAMAGSGTTMTVKTRTTTAVTVTLKASVGVAAAQLGVVAWQ